MKSFSCLLCWLKLVIIKVPQNIYNQFPNLLLFYIQIIFKHSLDIISQEFLLLFYIFSSFLLCVKYTCWFSSTSEHVIMLYCLSFCWISYTIITNNSTITCLTYFSISPLTFSLHSQYIIPRFLASLWCFTLHSFLILLSILHLTFPSVASHPPFSSIFFSSCQLECGCLSLALLWNCSHSISWK